ncbi:MAG: hypothetical protein ACTHKL_16110 [Streptosporangiaceae bacterium]
MRIRSRDGAWTVEVISLAGSGEWLRVKQHGWFCKPLVRTPGGTGYPVRAGPVSVRRSAL